MKAFCAVAAISLTLAAGIGSSLAQPYGGRGYDYEERGPRYRDRDYDDRDRAPRYGRDYDDRERGPRRGGFAFDEREYLRCNRDVLAAVSRGQVQSGFDHY